MNNEVEMARKVFVSDTNFLRREIAGWLGCSEGKRNMRFFHFNNSLKEAKDFIIALSPKSGDKTNYGLFVQHCNV